MMGGMGGQDGDMSGMDMGEDGNGVRPDGVDPDMDYSELENAPFEGDNEPMQEGDSESHDSGDL